MIFFFINLFNTLTHLTHWIYFNTLFNTLVTSTKKLRCRCSTGLRMCLQLKVLSNWCVDGLQVYDIYSRRLVFNEVGEFRSNYNKSYLWWFRNPACGDVTATNWIVKDRVGIPPGPVWEKEWGDLVCFSCVCLFVRVCVCVSSAFIWLG